MTRISSSDDHAGMGHANDYETCQGPAFPQILVGSVVGRDLDTLDLLQDFVVKI